jgi:hypothetical protein
MKGTFIGDEATGIVHEAAKRLAARKLKARKTLARKIRLRNFWSLAKWAINPP